MLFALIIMGGLGLLFAAFLAVADKFLRVEENPLIGEINDVLPGANCGACGYAGCYAFAEGVVEGKAPVNGCPVGGEDCSSDVAKLMGVDADAAEKFYPVVMCQGTNENAYDKPVDYVGPMTCETMDLVNAGPKSCNYGCLGGADCVNACTFDAMIMAENGLPQIVKELCTGCMACVSACPKNLIEMHPDSHKLFVLCKNEDDTKRSKNQCAVACTGCSACTRKAVGVEMANNRAIVNYDELDISTVDISKCKTEAIVDISRFEV